jgi:hypothetical protein
MMNYWKPYENIRREKKSSWSLVVCSSPEPKFLNGLQLERKREYERKRPGL